MTIDDVISYVYSVVGSWQLKPETAHIQIFRFLFKRKPQVRLTKIILNAAGSDEVNRYAELIEGGPLGRNLIEDMDRICYRYRGVASTGSHAYQVSKKNFCDLDFAQRIVRKMKNFHTEANKADQWSSQELTNIYNALPLNFVALNVMLYWGTSIATD